MNVSKTLRESRALLEPLGYEYVGVNGNSHFVFRHPSGARVSLGSATLGTQHGRGNLRAQARRNIKQQEGISAQWIQFLLDFYEVPADGEKTVTFQMGELLDVFKALHPEMRSFSGSLPAQAVKYSPLAEIVRAGRANWPSTMRLRGPLYGLSKPVITDVEVPDVPVVEPVREPRPVPAVAASSDPAVDAGGGASAGGEAEQPEPRDDPKPVEPDGSDRGLSLPAELANQLRAVLGADGDLQAENALLRETLTTVRSGLEMLSQAVQDALSLHTTPTPSKRHPGGLGVKRTQQVKRLREAYPFGSLTKHEVMDALGVGEVEAWGVLNDGNSAGVVHRVARGVYEWGSS